MKKTLFLQLNQNQSRWHCSFRVLNGKFRATLWTRNILSGYLIMSFFKIVGIWIKMKNLTKNINKNPFKICLLFGWGWHTFDTIVYVWVINSLTDVWTSSFCLIVYTIISHEFSINWISWVSKIEDVAH